MNLLYLHTHDMGRFNGVYGFNINTPAMQSLAEDGTVFRNAHCACPTCSPSRGALLTGQAPHVNGLMGLAHRGSYIYNNEHHLASFMAKQGFYTALAGVQHETTDRPSTLGYQRYIPAQNGVGSERHSDSIAFAAADYIKNELKEPFFLSVGFGVTHRKYLDHKIDPDYVQVPACLPDNAQVRADFADYVTSCEVLDRNMKTVLDALKEKNLYDSTLVILTTDHGVAFPFMKCTLYDSGTGVTLIIKPAGSPPKVKCTDALTSQIDVFPTICDFMGLTPPDWLEGCSLKPVIDGNKSQVRNELFTEITFHAAYEPVRAIRTERYKLIRHFDDEYTKQIMPNIDDGLSKRFLMEYGLAEHVIPRVELYDLFFDPNEKNNLADRPETQAIKNELSERLYDWMKKTNDPLLKGSMRHLPGQLLNRPDQPHPNKDYIVSENNDK